MSWTPDDDAQLRKFVKSGDLLYTEIAEKLRRRPQVVRWRAHKLGLDNTAALSKLGKWNTKHSHMRLAVMTYFLTHSGDQCMRKFGLTKSEFKSLMSISYRLPEFKHLRKEKRTHDRWTTEEYLFLLRHAGLKPRDWIAAKLKRGGPVGIKERLQKIGVSSRTLNGITLTQYQKAFGVRPSYSLRTKAGPGRSGEPTHFKIVPWVHLEKEMKASLIKPDPTFGSAIKTMAVFQRWVHGRSYIKSLELAAGRGHGFRVSR